MSTQNNEQSPHEEGREESHSTTQSSWKSTWQNNKGVFLILLSVLTGASMDAMARFLQQGGHSMNTHQVIFARMSATVILCTIYMWYKKTPDFPLGRPEVRGWLILRACFGYFGLWCLYYSVHYLPISESIVIRFLVPLCTAWACSIFLKQPFTSKEQLAALIALVGVVFIAHPSFIFGDVEANVGDVHSDKAGVVDDVTPEQRLIALAFSMMGIVGASGAYTTIRIIGDRAHALISVLYFAVLATVGSTGALLLVPGIGFSMPKGPREWVLLSLLGVLGFVLQFLLTAGLQLDKSSKATNMLYMQVIFALALDFAIWGVLPSGWSFFGGAIVIASTLWSALQNSNSAAPENARVADEETALLGSQVGEASRISRRASVDV
ncbi:hypothetical protein HYALB_00005322 [Hymenoscyphus albidus]|uniref:EamA domain-containing protein n=1 Tax=Hymenoscyphus albidus TaxID=595503 RepID=A0A9N9QCF8_9HELO|nr:hypothetical protein HYALB_00005322 [Hymenoscyphus albidus]